MSDHERGHVDASAAEVYDQLILPALFGRFADGFAACAAVEPHDSVVDVAGGTGALTRTIRSRTAGSVVGVDINSGMLAVARRYGGDIDYREDNAASFSFDDDSFDLATCRFGLMFLDEPAAAIAEMEGSRGAVRLRSGLRSNFPSATRRCRRSSVRSSVMTLPVRSTRRSRWGRRSPRRSL